MFTFLIRTLGLWLVAGAVVAIVIDGMKTIATGSLVLTPLLTTWSGIAPASFASAKAAVPAFLWDTVVTVLLGLPTWGVLFGLGLALIALGSRRRRTAYVV